MPKITVIIRLPKEIVLDLAEMTRAEQPAIEEELLDFGVVGPGPRRTLNFVFNLVDPGNAGRVF